MQTVRFLWAPDGAATSDAPTTKRVYGPFNKRTMAELDEFEEVARAAQTEPYAGILDTKYKITPARVATLLQNILDAERLFGTARNKELDSQGDTGDKDEAREAIIEAIDEFRTGARLSFSKKTEMEAFGVDVDLEKNESVLAQLAQTILDDPRSPTLDGCGPDEIAALQTTLDNWKTASGDQRTNQAGGEGDRGQAENLYEDAKIETRKIKIAIDGKFSYKDPANRTARKLFHLPPNSKYAPPMGE